MIHPFLLILIAMSCSVVGELALKHGMNQAGVFEFTRDGLVPSLVRTFSSPFVLVGLGIIFLGAVFWLAALSRVALSWAYPLLSLSYVVVVLLSMVLLREPVTWSRIAGAGIIVLGVLLVYRS